MVSEATLAVLELEITAVSSAARPLCAAFPRGKGFADVAGASAREGDWVHVAPEPILDLVSGTIGGHLRFDAGPMSPWK